MLFTFQYQWEEEDSRDEEGGLEKSQRQNKRLCQKICQICHRPIQKEEGVFVCVWKESHLPWVFLKMWRFGGVLSAGYWDLSPCFAGEQIPFPWTSEGRYPHTQRGGEGHLLVLPFWLSRTFQTNFARWKIKGGGGQVRLHHRLNILPQGQRTGDRNKTLSRIN